MCVFFFLMHKCIKLHYTSNDLILIIAQQNENREILDAELYWYPTANICTRINTYWMVTVVGRYPKMCQCTVYE